MSTELDWTNPEHRATLLAKVPLPKPDESRCCFYLDAESYVPDADAYVPSLVIEHLEGHLPMASGDPSHSAWHWGIGGDLEAAEAVCVAANLEHFGIDPGQSDEIVASSMGAHRLQEMTRTDTTVVVYAASDDLIMTEGAIDAEFYDPEFYRGSYVYVSTGDVIRFRLEDEGWRATVVVDETSPIVEHPDSEDDRVTLAGPATWIVASTRAPAKSS